MYSGRRTLVLASAWTLLLVVSSLGAGSQLGGHGSGPLPGSAGLRTAAEPFVGTALTATLTASPSNLQQGQSINFQVTANGGHSPYSYTYSGLPPGCSGQNTPSFSCNPSSTGTYTAQASVSDSGTNQTTTNSVSITVTSSGNGNGKGNGGGNNSSNPLSGLFSGFSGILSLLLILSLVGFVTWILLIVGVWIIAITLVRRLPKKGEWGMAGPMGKCAACSAAIPSGSKFCPACGTSTAPKAT
jgi:hypothetical protein